jgi:hypothetical protein
MRDLLNDENYPPLVGHVIRHPHCDVSTFSQDEIHVRTYPRGLPMCSQDRAASGGASSSGIAFSPSISESQTFLIEASDTDRANPAASKDNGNNQ